MAVCSWRSLSRRACVELPIRRISGLSAARPTGLQPIFAVSRSGAQEMRLCALGALAVVRWAYRTALRVNRELEEARLARMAETAVEPTDIPTLRQDPNTGAYRPG